jgi:TonB family protein
VGRIWEIVLAEEDSPMKARPYSSAANEAFKQSYPRTSAVALMTAVLLHFGFMALFPSLRAADLKMDSGALESIELPPEVRIPPPPEQISRPATPRVAAAEIAEDVTIAATTFESNPAERLPPPPKGAGDLSNRPTFIPYTQAPRLKNAETVTRLLKDLYPPEMKSSGSGGSVVLWLYVSEEGTVETSVVQASSGHDRLDAIAQEVAKRMVFTPAMNRDKRTAVWIAQRLDFAVA